MGKGEETRQAVLERATTLAARLGLAGVTIGELASSAGLSKSGLYAHFRSKEALQLAIIGHAREQFVDRVVRPALSTPRGEARVRALFEHWLTSCRDNFASGCLYLSSRSEFDDQPGAVRDQLADDYRDLLGLIEQVFRTAVEAGQFRSDADAAQFAQEFDGILMAYFSAHRLLRDPDTETRARVAFERLLRSVQPQN